MKYHFVFSMLRKIMFGLVVVSMLFMASPAAAKQPDREPAPGVPFTLTGICSFDVGVTFVHSNGYVTTFYDQDGNVKMQILGGVAIVELTNLSTGFSMTVNVSGPGENTINPDGSGSGSLTGPYLLWGPPNAEVGLPPLALTTGRAFYSWDVNGNITYVQFNGNYTDLCEALGC